MISDADLASWLRQAEQHVLDAQRLVDVLKQLLGSTPKSKGLGPAEIHAAARSRPTPRPTSRPARSAEYADLPVSAAIRRVLTSDGPLRARDVVERLDARGWRSPRSKTKDQRRATVSSTLSYLVTSGALRSVNAKDGIKVYALAKAPADAARKLAAATARVNGTPRSASKPTPTRPPTRAAITRAAHAKRSRAVRGSGRDLKSLILDAVADGVGATVPEILRRVVDAGWTTSAPSPAKRIAVDLSVLTRIGRILIDNPDRGPGERAVYRLAPAPDPIAEPEPTSAPDPQPSIQE